MSELVFKACCFVALLGLMAPAYAVGAGKAPISDLSQECIDCHSTVTPGMVADWKRSLHATVTPADAIKKPELHRRVAAQKIPDKLSGVVVGCAECHMLNPEAHKDTFNHNDQKVHLLVTPKDCAVCHSTEAEQYDKNIMSRAWANLAKNDLYQTLVKDVDGVKTFKDMKTTTAPPDEKTLADSCYQCHGTAVEVKGMTKRDTDAGTMEFPVLSGWPNQAVGRLNTDGSQGSCTPCHSRHQFSLQMARKPYACSQCHKGPDVPAYQAYSVSKHGNIFFSLRDEWDFKSVPWTVGKDFVAPTCAVCHVSLLVDTEGNVVAKRTHQMNDRLPWRIFGLPYAHPHPVSPDTTIIRNQDGQPLPTTLTGEPAMKFLIDPQEQTKRQEAIQKVCSACHTQDWIKGHWERFENTIKVTNDMTLTGTRILFKAWDEKVADKSNIFDEAIERMWVQQWLFYGNSTRFASAMVGADYGVFADGRWYLSKNIQDMLDHLKFLMQGKKK
jgi:hydroxylamine dehydrogenase